MDGRTKSKKSLYVWLIIIGVGLIMVIAGIIAINCYGLDYYLPREDISRDFSGIGVNNISIDSNIGELVINRSSDKDIHVEGKKLIKDSCTIEVNGDLFSIKYKKSWADVINIPWVNNKSGTKLTVSLPDKIYDEFKFDGGVGENKISDLSCRNADIDCGVGNSIFENLLVTNIAEFDFGTGKSTFENCILTVSNFDIGVGNVEYSGKILGDTNIDCGVGKTEFNIDGYKDDYDIDYDKGVGDVKISSKTSGKSSFENKAKLNISGGVGEFIVNFK